MAENRRDRLYRTPHPGGPMSVEDYLLLDENAVDARYEYLNGRARMMAGGTFEHDDIVSNIFYALKQQFRNGPCRMHGNGVKAQLGKKEDGTIEYVYPDVTVTCNVADRKYRGERLITAPLIVVEVLSPSNENDDRTIKMRAYQACPTIKAILLISQFARHVEVYKRPEETDATWTRKMFNDDETVQLDCLDLALTMDEIYLDIDFSLPLKGED